MPSLSLYSAYFCNIISVYCKLALSQMIHKIKLIFPMFRSAWCLMTGHSGPSCVPWSPSRSQSPCLSRHSPWRPSRWTGIRSSPHLSTQGQSSGEPIGSQYSGHVIYPDQSGTGTGSWFSSGASHSSSLCPGLFTTLSSQHSPAPLTIDVRFVKPES